MNPQHPTILKMARHAAQAGEQTPTQALDPIWLRNLVLAAGADDVGFVGIDRPELDDQRADLKLMFPMVRTVITYAVRMQRDPILSPLRSLANHEFHSTSDDVDDVGRRVAKLLTEQGTRALNHRLPFRWRPPASRTKRPGPFRTNPSQLPAGWGRWAFIEM